MFRNKKRILSMLCVCTLLLASCGKGQEPSAPELLLPLEAQQESRKAAVRDLYTCSLIETEVTVATCSTGFRRSGTVDRIAVRIGDTVKKGDLLAVLDSSEDQKTIDELKKQIDTYSKLSDNKSRELEMKIEEAGIRFGLKSGKEKELIGLELEELRLAADYNSVLQTQELDAMQKELEKLQKNAVGYELYAPESGVIACIGGFVPGSVVSAGKEQFVIAKTELPCLITTKLLEEDLEKYEKILAKVGAVEYELELYPYTEEEENSLIFSGRQIPVRFTFKNQGKEIPIGDYCALLLYSNIKEQVLSVPTNAILSNDAGEYVYVNQNGEREYRKITVGTSTGTYTEVINGLSNGEEVFLQDTALSVTGDYTVTEVQYDNVRLTKQLSGASLGYTDSIPIRYDDYGTVEEVFVKSGDYVREGTPLLTISMGIDRMYLLNTEINVKVAEIDYQKAIQEKEKETSEQKLLSTTASSSGERELAACKSKILEIELERYILENEEAVSKKRKDYEELAASSTITVTAPADGYVEWITTRGSTSGYWAQLGSIISSDCPLLFVEDNDKILKYMSKVTVTGILDKTQVYEGTVIYAANTVPGSIWKNTAMVKVDEFVPGQNMILKYQVDVPLISLDNVLTVNSNAVNSGTNYSVYLMEDGVISTQPVGFGKWVADKAWILSGLTEGQQIVVRNRD